MNKKNFIRIFVCLIALTQISCSKNQLDKTLDQIYNIADSNKPLALSLVDSLGHDQNSFTEYQHNRYLVYNTMIKDKNYGDISSDTLIFETKKYFVEKKDNLHSALAFLYSARVYTANNAMEKAFFDFLKADDYIEHTKETRVKAVIAFNLGNNCLKRDLYPNALQWFRKSIINFEKVHDMKSATSLNINIANCHYLNANTDSALYYYDKGMKLADQNEDRTSKFKIQSNLGALYQKKGKIEDADLHYKQAVSYSTTSIDSSRIYVYLADMLMVTGKGNSAKAYIDKAVALIDTTNHDDLPLYCEILNMQSNWAELNGDFKKALQYNRTYTDNLYQILSTINAEEILEIEKKFENEKLKREKSDTIIAKQKSQLFALISSLVAGIVIVLLYLSARRYKNNLAEVELKIVQLSEIAKKYQSEPTNKYQPNDTVQLIMHKYFNILTKAALIEGFMKEDERIGGQKLLGKFNDIVYGKNAFDWDTFLITTNEMKNNVLEKVRLKFPDLDDIEYKTFCLAYCELTNMEISMILGINVNTIKKRKLAVRHKLGIKGYSNFIEEVNQLVAE